MMKRGANRVEVTTDSRHGREETRWGPFSPDRFHNRRKRIYSAVAFLLSREGREFGPDRKWRQNFDNIQRQVRRLRGGDDSARVLIECVDK